MPEKDELRVTLEAFCDLLKCDYTDNNTNLALSAKSALAISDLLDSDKYLRDLLAIMHRDGGHYTAAHGLKKSVDDAMQAWYKVAVHDH